MSKEMWGTVTSLAKNINDSVHIILEPCSISIRSFHTEKRNLCPIVEWTYVFTLRYPLKDLSAERDVVGIVVKMELAL
jgi:hypothetical protein